MCVFLSGIGDRPNNTGCVVEGFDWKMVTHSPKVEALVCLSEVSMAFPFRDSHEGARSFSCLLG